MKGINFKALVIAIILTILLNFILDFIIAFVSHSFLSLLALILWVIQILLIILYPAIAAYIYYKFNDSTITMSDGALVGASYRFLYLILKSLLILVLIIFFPGVMAALLNVGLTKQAGGLYGSNSANILLSYFGPIIAIITLIWGCICWLGQILLCAAIGAIVGAILGKKKSQDDLGFEESKTSEKSKTSLDESW
jgi:hypothetical protein